jgi:hypothetical protein
MTIYGRRDLPRSRLRLQSRGAAGQVVPEIRRPLCGTLRQYAEVASHRDKREAHIEIARGVFGRAG